MPSDYYSSVYIFVLGITLQLMGHLHAMAIHNNAVELARLRVLIHFAIALTHSVNQSCVCSWAVGPETLLHYPGALRNPWGMSAVRERRPEERKQGRRRGQERRKEQRGSRRRV